MPCQHLNDTFAWLKRNSG